jgi:tRNA-uridine 2-sulfurtransferase
MSKKKVVVALSGGVDSSVSAYLLKKKGYDVIGLFMKNWHDESVTISKECPWLQDSNDAMLIAQKLGIPFKIIDLSVEYKKRIVDYMFSEYKKGRTPNPDVICNREIKFDVFLKIALSMDADYVATGHYCQKKSFENSIGEQVNSLLSGVDKTKDQSYFLCQINQFQLQKVIFPIGGLKKNEVRKIAKEIGLVTADKKDSQGLCFIGKISLPEFLSQKLKPKEGKIIQIKDELKKLSENLYGKNFDIKLLNELSKKRRYKINEGEVIGAHKGAHFFTIGQRKGLSVGGHSQPLFVINTDVKNNLVYVGEGANHTGLFRRALKIKKGSEKWIRSDLTIDFDQRMDVLVRIRYRQPLQEAIIYKKKEGFFIVFKNHQSSITSGQFAAWYVDEELIGSGVIN